MGKHSDDTADKKREEEELQQVQDVLRKFVEKAEKNAERRKDGK